MDDEDKPEAPQPAMQSVQASPPRRARKNTQSEAALPTIRHVARRELKGHN